MISKKLKFPLVVVFNSSEDAKINQEDGQFAFIYSQTGLDSLKGNYSLFEEIYKND